MKQDTFNILIGGEAGQGLVTTGTILARSLTRTGYSMMVTQNYESRIRGGHNTLAIRFGLAPIISPTGPVDLLLCLAPETIGLHRGQLTSRGRMIADVAFGPPQDDAWVAVPFRELAEPRMLATACVSVAAAMLGLNRDLIAQTINDVLGARHPDLVEANRKVLSNAYAWVSGRSIPRIGLPPVTHPQPRMVMDGNEAIAAGAMSAGMRFGSYYPMTPGSSIMQALITHARNVGLVIEQAEDEIAAINMAMGAAFAGAPSMVSTSGGGFALMVEGVSLAAMMETPVVIVVAQRPGPATGLPTRTEQGDLEFVLHSGHGEWPRAVFAPGDPEQCFHLARKAFELADRYQGPMFILTDQFLADSSRSVEPFDVPNLPTVAPQVAHSANGPHYHRYAITESGVSPRLVPCRTKHLVVTDSNEHGENGRMTEDLRVRVSMVDKRLRKGTGIRAEVIPPERTGEEAPDILLVSWGSTKGPMEEAAAEMRDHGASIGALHFSQVWPLVPEQFVRELEKARQVICIESNATAQFGRLIRRETGFHIVRHVLRYDGLPITPDYILDKLQAIGVS